MDKQFFNPTNVHRPRGYTHAVAVEAGRLIFIAGQVALDKEGNLVGKGDLRAQTIQTFENLQHALAAAGATFRDVVKSNLYVVGLKSEHVPIIREVRGRYFSAEHPPASTLVGVEKLVGPDWLIEIEVIAVV